MTALNPKLQKIFSEILKEPVENISIESSPRTLNSWDSMRHVELVIAVEEAYNISFSTTEITSINSFRGFSTMLESKGVSDI